MKVMHKLGQDHITACGKKRWKRGAYSWANTKINCRKCLERKCR